MQKQSIIYHKILLCFESFCMGQETFGALGYVARFITVTVSLTQCRIINDNAKFKNPF